MMGYNEFAMQKELLCWCSWRVLSPVIAHMISVMSQAGRCPGFISIIVCAAWDGGTRPFRVL